ncbi:uncharacterized protein LOC101758964 [Setaria italica]|uniref:uncharacterized protein LOC101758964 n=1 Tax=Setaria italica TaxID=4555 RepID=UPI0003510152|nr:uncharacterized protein LOC101758964 [Setaria italica]
MDNFTSLCFTNAMDGYLGSLRRYWMMEEEDNDTHFLVDDDEADAVTYNHLVQVESSRTRHRFDAPRKVIRPKDLPSGHKRIKADYFATNPVYNDKQFRRRFRMHRYLFKHIKEVVKNQDNYFKKKYDATGKAGLSSLQKCVAAMRILAYGVPADAVDEYVRIGESTAQKALHHFCRAVIDVFGEYYLQAPNAANVARLLQEGEDRGFLRMLGNIDCMHWEWRNYPTSWKGQFTGRGKHPSMILEVVASHDLWIWHAYFGMPGSNNDINVFHRSPVFSACLKGHSTPVSFAVNGRTYNMGYYLADGIYPKWAAFVKTIRYPMEQKTRHFATKQESACKDIERAFGFLQTRFAVIRGPTYGWDCSQINDIMVTCIIFHNMIVEDEQDNARDIDFLNIG